MNFVENIHAFVANSAQTELVVGNQVGSGRVLAFDQDCLDRFCTLMRPVRIRARIRKITIACFFTRAASRGMVEYLSTIWGLEHLILHIYPGNLVNEGGIYILRKIGVRIGLRGISIEDQRHSAVVARSDTTYERIFSSLNGAHYDCLQSLSIGNCYVETPTFELLVARLEDLPNLRKFKYEMLVPGQEYWRDCVNITPAMTAALLTSLRKSSVYLQELVLQGFLLGRETDRPFAELLTDRTLRLTHLQISTYPAGDVRTTSPFSDAVMMAAIFNNTSLLTVSLPTTHRTAFVDLPLIEWRNNLLSKTGFQINGSDLWRPLPLQF